MAIDLNQPKPVINRATLIEATWVFLALTTVFFFVRLTIRFKIFKRLMWDDAWVVLAYLLLLGNAIVTTLIAPYMYYVVDVNLGLDQVDADDMSHWVHDSTEYMKLQLANTLIFWGTLWAVKAGFLSFFKRLTDGLDKRYVYSWWAIAIITTLSFIGSVITYPLSCASFVITACNDPDHIHNSIVSFQFSTCVDIITDALIMALPLALAFRVKIPTSQKLALGGIFSLGIFIMIFSVLRVVIANHSGAHPEITWLCLWSAVEASVAVIIICVASFRALFVQRQSTQNSNSRYPYVNSTSQQRGSGFRQLDSSRSAYEKEARGNSRLDEIELYAHEANLSASNHPAKDHSDWPLPE